MLVAVLVAAAAAAAAGLAAAAADPTMEPAAAVVQLVAVVQAAPSGLPGAIMAGLARLAQAVLAVQWLPIINLERTSELPVAMGAVSTEPAAVPLLATGKAAAAAAAATMLSQVLRALPIHKAYAQETV